MRAMRRRLSLAWHVFRGRPLAYRINVEDGGLVLREDRSWAVECVVVGAADRSVTFADGVRGCRAVSVTATGSRSGDLRARPARSRT